MGRRESGQLGLMLLRKHSVDSASDVIACVWARPHSNCAAVNDQQSGCKCKCLISVSAWSAHYLQLFYDGLQAQYLYHLLLSGVYDLSLLTDFTGDLEALSNFTSLLSRLLLPPSSSRSTFTRSPRPPSRSFSLSRRSSPLPSRFLSLSLSSLLGLLSLSLSLSLDLEYVRSLLTRSDLSGSSLSLPRL